MPDGFLWDRWAELDELLETALDLPPDRRTAFVADRERDDPAIGALLRRLITNSAATGGRADTPAEYLVRDSLALPGDPDLAPGTSVGRWVILRRRGRGGMATVYEAQRADGAYEQRAALKVLRRGLDTEDLIQRFLVERQILSTLTHPNIARLLDGGSTDDGRPFLVMELVEGEPITAWADAHSLDLERRLGLFLGVADAVHAAHRQLVVHRDIKPSNVMVDAEGRVRLLDFGIARLLNGEPEITTVGARALTPRYSSPELLRGDAITTASDIYQLGLLLHELLTGCRPEAGKSPGRASRMAREAGDTLRARRLEGDLDLILGTALRNEPDARYASVDEFAADVRRHLGRLPVHAHPESAKYRFRKFLDRHPLVLPGATAAVLALGAFITVLALQNRRLERERNAAEVANRRSQETQAFLVDLLQSPDPIASADPERGRTITVVEALRLGATRIDEEVRGDPLLRASLLGTIGRVFGNLGQWAEARTLVEQSLALRAANGDTLSADFSMELGLLGGMLAGLGQTDSALVVARHRLALERTRDPPAPILLGEALTGMSDRLGPLDPASALTHQEEAVQVLQAGDDLQLGSAIKTLADRYNRVGRHGDATAMARRAVAVLTSALGPDHPTTAMAIHSLGQALGGTGEYPEAAQYLERSLLVFERHLGPTHPFTYSMRGNYGVLLLNAEDPIAAEPVFRRLAEDLSRGPEASSTVRGNTLQNLAVALLRQGRLIEAEGFIREAEAVLRTNHPPGSVSLAFPMLTRAEIQLARGEFGAAHRTATQIRAILHGKLPDSNPARLVADCRLGRAQAGLGQTAAARAILDTVLARMKGAEGLREAHRRECQKARATLATDPG
jgi:serine/threonine-protein kinase